MWPQDHEADNRPNHQSCCWRPTLADAERCAWHADPENTDVKTITALQEARQDSDAGDRTTPVGELLDGAILSGLELDGFALSQISLRGADLTDAKLEDADLSDTNLEDADLTNAILPKADLTDTYLWQADLTDANLGGADLTDAILGGADLTDANLGGADLTDANLGGADLTDANLWKADMTDVDMRTADLTDAILGGATLINADLRAADLTDANLPDADLTNASLERAKLIGTNLFDAALTRVTPYGARFTRAQINDGTDFHADTSEYASWWQRGPFSPTARCGYDPALTEDGDDVDAERLTKAADTYKQFEQLASDNTLPVKESSMFILRQDMQRKRHRLQRDPVQYVFAIISGGVFRYGESLARIFTWALMFVFGYAAAYKRFDLIVTESGAPVSSFLDALYFSTLTFTTLGLGDFKPDPTVQLARVLVTSQAVLGAILIAIFVFVLGRRAAR